MANAHRLPSGSWRVQVFSHYEIKDGKKIRKYESFTSSDKTRAGKREAERMAAEWVCGRAERHRDVLLIDAVNSYIDAKKGVLAANTVRGYNSYKKTWIEDIGDMPVDAIDKPRLQMWVAKVSDGRSPKAVRNIIGLLSASYKYATGKTLNLTLPPPKKPDLYTPVDDDIQKLLDHVRGTELEIAIMLSAFCSLRRGEICALTSDDFKDGMVHVSKNMARTVSGSWEIKTPKTPGSDRWVPVPDVVMDLVKDKEGRIISCHPDALSNRFKRAIKYSHLEHFRFHDLRHYYASTAHYLGVPDAYIMASGGWASDNVMKRVYREALKDKQKTENDKIAEYATRFSSRQPTNA